MNAIKNYSKEQKAARNLDPTIFDDPNEKVRRPMSASIFRRTAGSNFSMGKKTSEKVIVGKFEGKKITMIRKGSSYS